MITTTFKRLAFAVIGLVAGISAQAQFSGSAEQYPTTDWSAAPIEFSLSEVANALSTDAATLGAAIQEYITAETPATLLFAANGTPWAAALEAANHGFWMSTDGMPVGYDAENCAFYASPEVDEEFTTLTFGVGQKPNMMAVGSKGETTISLSFNEKVVTFALTLNVIAKPVYEVPEPQLLESKLTIVGEQEVIVEQYPRGGYDSDPVKVKLGDALTLLGISDANMMSEALEQLLYATVYNTGDVESGGGMKKDSLSNEATAGGIGWWVRPVQNAEGQETGECSAAGWGDSDRFFVESFAYDAEKDSLTCNLGQYPGSCKDNEKYFTYIYIIYGEKAYRIKYSLNILEKEAGNGLADYTKVGEETVVLEQEPLSDWAAVQAKPDMEAIAAALGCEVSAVGLVALDDKDNFGASTANNGGWWLTEVGTVVAYANGAFYIEPATANDYSVLNVGHKPGTRQVGDELTASHYFTNATNYYQYNVTLKIVEPKKVDYEFESVETRTFAVQALLDNSYAPLDLITIPAENLEAVLGTATPELYGQNIDSVAVVKGDYSKAYSCDPKPGFWLNKDGRVSVWGDADARVGICWVDNSILRFFQHPNRNAIGDVFTTQLFLVNEATNKMITLNIKLSFVESLEEKEIVGSENIVVPFDLEDITVPIDLAKAAEALGVETADLLSPDNYYLRALQSDGVYGEGVNCENGLSFAADGGYDSYGSYILMVEEEGDGFVISTFSNDPVPEDYNVNAQFCFEVNNKQYVYYAKFVSTNIYVGIDAVSAATPAAARIYDLSGRQVAQPRRGIYIRDGRKYIVK